MSVSPQWELNRTATDLQNFIHDAMIVSTSDRVEFNALYVAEAFGATVAMSDESRLKVEQAAKFNASATIQFLQAKIGYAKGDAPDFLSKTDGGVRLLGLASALLCTSSHLFAARAMDMMIQNSAPFSLDRRILPTILQLERLFAALDSKLSRSGFAELVSGWQVWLGNLPGVNQIFTQRSRHDDTHPPAEMLAAIVEAFRSIKRIGVAEEENDADETTIEIWAHESIPWITAFTKWSLGSLPIIRLQNGTTLVGEPSGARVCLWVGLTAASTTQVKMVHRLKHPTILWSGPTGNPLEIHSWAGMLPLGDYGRQQIMNLGFVGEGIFALQQALSASLPKTVECLWPTASWPLSADDPPYHPSLASPSLSQYRTRMFAEDVQLQRIFHEYTGAETIMIAQEKGESVFGQKKVESYELHLARQCACADCLDRTRSSMRATIRDEKEKEAVLSALALNCPVNIFRRNVASVATEILALSLFDCVEPLRVFWPGRSAAKERVRSNFLNAVESIISPHNDDEPAFCRVHDILGYALSLVGHDMSAETEAGTWMASAWRGQVFYPRLLDVRVLEKFGVLSLGGGTGKLTFQGDEYHKVLSKRTQQTLLPTLRDASNDFSTIEVLEPLHLFPNEIVEWQLTRSDGHLTLTFGPTSYPKTFNPFDALITIARSIFISCGHLPSSLLRKPDKFCTFVPHLIHLDWSLEQYNTTKIVMRKMLEHVNDKIEIIPTSGDEQLRLFVMASSVPGVVRYGACLECCIQACSTASLPFIVL